MSSSPARKFQAKDISDINIYKVIIRPCTDTSGYYAVCDMPNGGTVTQGETLWKTKMNMFEAMALYLEDFPDIADYDLNFEIRHA